LGEPGDLAFTINCVHQDGYIPLSHAPPMVVASLFSIIGGGSLGPEAPLVAICAALGGFVSRQLFKQTDTNVIRKHTLMGMAGVLAAFFGCPLGGSLFALEVCSRFGIEYFEHTVEAIFCGVLTVGFFRTFLGIPLGPIWSITAERHESVEPVSLLVGACIGLLGAFVGMMFTHGHWAVMGVYDRFGLLDNQFAVPRALLGCTVITIIGMFIPHTMFWGEEEFQTLAALETADKLPHVFPTSGLLGFEMDSCFHAIIVGVFKVVAVSFSVAGGYRGGFIFPFFSAGAAFGRSLVFIFPSLSPSLACLCFAAGINVSITKTSLATALILMKLSGEINLLPPILAASLTSLFATSYMPFIKTQVSRTEDGDIAEYRPSMPNPVSSVRALFKNLQLSSFLFKGGSIQLPHEDLTRRMSNTICRSRRNLLSGYHSVTSLRSTRPLRSASFVIDTDSDLYDPDRDAKRRSTFSQFNQRGYIA